MKLIEQTFIPFQKEIITNIEDIGGINIKDIEILAYIDCGDYHKLVMNVCDISKYMGFSADDAELFIMKDDINNDLPIATLKIDMEIGAVNTDNIIYSVRLTPIELEYLKNKINNATAFDLKIKNIILANCR